ncbi:DNA replication/repair protein RecF [Paenibacillus sp. JMULE4]|uniref:DNA replication/repair protein RecF n=1 Tax=Paenibacillus TaxID=44249 RepID=UPI00157662EC|nr:DNA replication/repair protein RecF [Paenibacillus sp. JMULE4]NTZ16033.1 DNA replication/repair protein RecF [Paenibacillus sp. JMULE4]
MQLKRLLVQHYRNYEQVEFQTDRMVNIIVGPNAQGKTNLLESIFVLALTKSHRTNQDKELIRWNEKKASLHAEIEKRYGTLQLDLIISQQGKRAKINGLEQKRLSHFIGALNVVMFAPEDLEIVKGSPSVRRRFLDMEIGQVHPAYLYDLSQYNKVLQQRNNYLKQLFSSSGDAPLLEVWNEQLAQFGIKIMKKRQSFIKKLQIWAEKIHAGITNGMERLRIEYDSAFANALEEEEAVLFDRFMIKLSQVKDQEIRRGVTLVGPHRDDLRFYINDKEVQTFGSQGQQRTTALSLKLAEIELICEEVGEYPLLLLDDVLSELDRYRQTQLIETFQRKVQTFITTTGIESIDLSKLENASVIHVRDGSLT